MTTPKWQAAVPGSPSYAGQINQLLAAHSSTFCYAGSPVPGTVDPTSITTAVTSDRISTAQCLAQQFIVTGSSNITLASIAPALVAEGAGCDLLLTIQPATVTPSGFTQATALAYVVIPAEWLPTTTPSSGATIPQLPLNIQPSLTPGATPYWVTIAPYSNCVPGINDVLWARSGGGFTGQPYAYNVSTSTWATTGSSAFATFFRYGYAGAIVATTEDNDSMKKSYVYGSSSQIASAYEWVVGQSNPNILCRDDSLFSKSIGSWVGTNSTLALGSGAYAGSLSSSTSAVASVTLTLAGGANFFYPATPATTYTFVAQVRAGTTARALTPFLSFYNSSTSSWSTVTGAPVTDTTTGWTAVSFAATSPANTTYIRSGFTYATTSATAEAHYVDNVMIASTPSSTFAPPQAGLSTVRALSYSGSNLIAAT